jgi:hypothetical protein
MAFPRKPIPAQIPDLPDLYIRKWSIPELFEIQEILKNGGSLDALTVPQIRRIMALSVSDASGARLIHDGAEVEADDLGSDIIRIIKLAVDHNGMSDAAKNA